MSADGAEPRGEIRPSAALAAPLTSLVGRTGELDGVTEALRRGRLVTLTGDVLARLVDKSLVTVGQGRRGRTRYRLLETVREYGLELLATGGELDAAEADT